MPIDKTKPFKQILAHLDIPVDDRRHLGPGKVHARLVTWMFAKDLKEGKAVEYMGLYGNVVTVFGSVCFPCTECRRLCLEYVTGCMCGEKRK